MSAQVWQADLYDRKFDFNFEHGKGVVDLLNPKQGEKILDLGCGTGELAYEMAKCGATIIGLDQSFEMIEAARSKFPEINFMLENAERFELDEQVDAVFSNAALHWMQQPERVIQCIWNALKPGGRFVAEFGGQGNVEKIIKAISHVLKNDYQIDASDLNPWYFPSVAQYSTLLEQQGYRVTYVAHFDRPTKMKDGNYGHKVWLSGFAESFFKGFTDEEKKKAISKIESAVSKSLFKHGDWYVDYVRLRVMAVKQR